MDDDNLLDELNKLIIDMEEDILEIDLRSDQFDSDIAEIASGSMPRGYGDHDLIAMPLVAYLPELGGSLTVNHDFSTIGTVSKKAIYDAIAKGDLAVVKLNKNFHVTKAALKDWIASCQSQTRISSNEKPATKTVSSRTKALGTSNTTDDRLRQDALSQMLKKLR